MRNSDESSSVPGYLSVKEAVQALGLSPSRIYEYVEDGRLSSVRAAHVILIPVADVQQFAPAIAGRPRKSLPRWRVSPENNALLATVIRVPLVPEATQRLETHLARIKQDDRFLFPGTIARFIRRSETVPDRLEIFLVWRTTALSDEAERQASLRLLQEALADVVQWQQAEYDHGPILMHT